MADRRSFSRKILESEPFITMSYSAQLLYIHLCMHADNDGFVNAPGLIRRSIGASEEDLQMLLKRNYLIAFRSGVIVIRHWRVHNYIRGDRNRVTDFPEEQAMLQINGSEAYELKEGAETGGSGSDFKREQISEAENEKRVKEERPEPCLCHVHAVQETGESQPDASQMPDNDMIEKDQATREKMKEESIGDSGLVDADDQEQENTGKIKKIRAEGNGRKKEESKPAEPAVLQVPLIDGTMYDITQSEIDTFSKLYPAVNVLQELRSLVGWNMTNPRRRKTRSGIRSHINKWLSGEQNRSRSVVGRAAQGPVNDYDNPFL